MNCLKSPSKPVNPIFLIKDKYLSEFKTAYERALVRKNLGLGTGSEADFIEFLEKLDALEAKIKALTANDVTFDYSKTDYTKKTVGEAIYKINSELEEILQKLYPLTVSYASTSNFGTFEVGTTVIPEVTLSITRKEVEITPDTVTPNNSGTYNSENNSVIWPETTSNKTYNVSITLNGETITTSNLNVAFSNYRYRGEISSMPSDYATTIKSLSTKELTTTATLSSTALSANKYYLFAVKGTPTLVCHHASTDGIISGCVTGTCSITQENDSTKSNIYSYILIPASTSAWNFTIKNS